MAKARRQWSAGLRARLSLIPAFIMHYGDSERRLSWVRAGKC